MPLELALIFSLALQIGACLFSDSFLVNQPVHAVQKYLAASPDFSFRCRSKFLRLVNPMSVTPMVPAP